MQNGRHEDYVTEVQMARAAGLQDVSQAAVGTAGWKRQ